MQIQCASITSTLRCVEPNSRMHIDFKWPHLHTQLPMHRQQIFTSASHHIASQVEQIRGTQCVAQKSALTVSSQHEHACHALLFLTHNAQLCIVVLINASNAGVVLIQFNLDQNHPCKWIGIIRIGSGLGECAFSVDALKPDSIWLNAHWVSSVHRPLADQNSRCCSLTCTLVFLIPAFIYLQ